MFSYNNFQINNILCKEIIENYDHMRIATGSIDYKILLNKIEILKSRLKNQDLIEIYDGTIAAYNNAKNNYGPSKSALHQALREEVRPRLDLMIDILKEYEGSIATHKLPHP